MLKKCSLCNNTEKDTPPLLASRIEGCDGVICAECVIECVRVLVKDSIPYWRKKIVTVVTD